MSSLRAQWQVAVSLRERTLLSSLRALFCLLTAHCAMDFFGFFFVDEPVCVSL